MFKNRSKDLLPISTYFGYGVGQIGGQILRDTPALILPIYMTTVLGLDAALSGLVIIIAKFWTIISNLAKLVLSYKCGKFIRKLILISCEYSVPSKALTGKSRRRSTETKSP